MDGPLKANLIEMLRSGDAELLDLIAELVAARSFLNVQNSTPVLNSMAIRLKNLPNLAWNVKFFGYELAQQLQLALPARNEFTPRVVGLKSKPSTQADLESDWVAHWCSELRVPVVFHRKLWELSYVLQALYERSLLRPGGKGLGFGCGEEPLASYFASKNIDVTVTDLPPEDRASQGWASTGQYTSSLEQIFRPALVSRESFDCHVKLQHLDMNEIPEQVSDYDFCWSVCALEHLGSIQKGLDFIVHSLDVLKPGGVAVHTTEFNFLDDNETVDEWPTVLFQRKHFITVVSRLRAEGHTVAELDFDVGQGPLDRFIDIPPYLHDWSEALRAQWGHLANHLKLTIDGFASTCFGIIVQKAA